MTTRIAIGSRGELSFAEEEEYGIAIDPVKRIDFVSESIANNIEILASNALNPNRAVSKVVRSTSDIGGDIAYEQNTHGFGTWYKHALGDAITLVSAGGGVDGGVRCQLDADATVGQTALVVKNYNMSTSFPSSGIAVIVSRDANGDLVQDPITFSARDGTGGLTVADLSIAAKKGDRIFLAHADYDGVYTHYIEAGKTLPESLTIEVGRDIVYFTYSGCKINTFEETFNAKEMLTGTFSVVGREESSGGDSAGLINTGLAAGGIAVGDTTVWLKAGSFTTVDGTGVAGFKQVMYPTGGTWSATDQKPVVTTQTYKLQIEGENDITYTAIALGPSSTAFINGIPANGAGSITLAHGSATSYVPIAPQSSAAQNALTPTSQEPLTSFQAAMYVDGVFNEILNASFSVNNNLFTGKFQLGDRYRAQLPEQLREVTGSITVEFDDLVMYRKFVNSTDTELEIRCVDDGTDGQIGATGVYRQKHIIFPKVKFTGNTPVIGGPDVITMDMAFQSFYDTDDDEPEIIMILVNNIAADTTAPKIPGA